MSNEWAVYSTIFFMGCFIGAAFVANYKDKD